MNFIQGISVSHSTLYRGVHSKLQAKFKVPRPKAAKQDKEAIKQFWLELPKCLSELKSAIQDSVKKASQFHD
ncbi:MAG: hypothetical protein J7641_21205 [Cyanobacteria bacterium SID2]|nr:hypothetical protein [Cyanobacteria bacterium SID2]MBP0006372.1 hypothetical protein [Cyanobacteria bacterium SBC]